MSNLVCNYTMVRFLPYRETGEFVNVGAIVYAPEAKIFQFKLTGKSNKRVRGFFPEMDQTVYRAAIEALRRELMRQQMQYAAMDNLAHGLDTFRNLLRRKETLLHFAEPGMRIGTPADVLDAIYADYVERNFAQTVEYQEGMMRSRLGKWLKEWGIKKKYKTDLTVGDTLFHLTLPFVHAEQGKVIAAIKPLDLDRGEPTKIYDHGGLWIQRFKRLQERNHLPERMIVPVRMPPAGQSIAADQIFLELIQLNVKAVSFNDQQQIHTLADA